jgi:hypothetical protein
LDCVFINFYQRSAFKTGILQPQSQTTSASKELYDTIAGRSLRFQNLIPDITTTAISRNESV